MLRGFIIVAEIIILVVILRSDFAQYIFKDLQKFLADWFVHVAEIPEQNELRQLQGKTSPTFETLRPFQKEYLTEIMSSRTSLNRFYSQYCLNDDKNPYIYGGTLHYFCDEIQRTSLLDSG
ncbi:hypothetical protein CA267_005830 [Alteromonas pelagimontana]|uniref:Uncharacterized protein n=1 Tax=Alteromonas pelagimontana TaxID=1858656 RepID=A0A6M4MBZ4_9ALTE|nr:hypothetical protein [Alteromonas pelagimontana]QJR80328.1 hypothetical protein CA267_005830 [Alteromonas pelagimontana]